jgi:hypothetical protein
MPFVHLSLLCFLKDLMYVCVIASISCVCVCVCVLWEIASAFS